MRKIFSPKPLPLAGAIMTALLGLQAHPAGAQALPSGALPTNGQVVHGTASITQSGNALSIRQSSSRLITHWDTFNIGSGARVDFLQPSTSSMALNRVLSADPSRIYGQLNANGQLFLVNPAGVLFAPGSKVNVGGLVASALDISNADFAAGNFRFTGGALATGEVANEGEITTADKGYAALLGPRVRNAGSIVARMGTVALAAGDAVTLDLHGDQLINLQIDGAAAGALAANSGALRADGGLVLLAAGSSGDPLATVLNNTGTIHSTTLANVNGVIRLEGGANGVVAVNGTLDASGRGAGETGGTVKVLGDKVGLFDGARIDVSGDAGGGTALVGGNWQGSGHEQRAGATYVDANAKIAADAVSQGDGGKVVVWADGATRYYGAISARGGAQGGNGGQVETSGKEYLDAAGSVSASAALGKAGAWLLDPRNVSITTTTSGGSLTAANPSVFAPTADTAKISVTEINTALNAGTSVLINTGAGGTQNGDITVASNILKSGGGDATLTLQAARDINVNANIISNTGKLGVVLNSATAGVGSVSIAAGASIITNGGNLTIGGGANPATSPAVGGGVTNIGFRMLGGGALLSTGDGNILINAKGASTSQAFSMASSANTIQTTNGSITINATNAGASSFGMNSGTNTIQSTGKGNITIDTQATGAAGGFGLTMGSSGTSTIRVADGTLSITAKSASSDSALTMGSGVNTLEATGTGSILINATSSSSGSGLTMGSGGTNVIATVNGSLTANGASASGFGINLGTGAGTNTIRTAGGDIGLTGASGTGTAFRMAPDQTLGKIEATGAGNITITADTLAIAPSGTGSAQIKGNGGALVIQSQTDGTSIGVGMGSGSLSINAAALAALQDGFSSITIGRATGTGAINVGSATFNDNLVLRQAGGGVTFGGALSLGTNSLAINSGGGTIGNVQVASAGNVNIGGAGAVGFGDTKAAGTLNVSANGDITQAAGSAITVAGATTLAAGSANDITLAEAGNDFSSVGITSGRNVSVRDSGTLQMAASTVSGALTLRSNGALTQSGVLTIAGGLDITTDQVAGDVTLNNSGSAATTLGDTRIGNNYTLTTGGDISQAGGTTLVIGNNFNVSGGTLAAPAAGNVIGGTDNSAGSGTVIKQVGIVDLSTKDIGGGAGTLAVGGNLSVQSVASADTIAATVGAGTTAVNFGLANNIGGAISISASAPTVTPSGAAVATGIVQNGAVISVGGSASFSAATSSANAGGTAGNITLDGKANQFGGPVSFSGHNVLINSATALALGASSATGTLALRATSGNISGSGVLTAAGDASFAADAGGASITLDNTGNVFGGAVSFTGAGGLANVSIADSTTLDLQALTLSGNLQAKAASISDSGALSIGGTAALQATGDVVLDNAGHQFTGAVTVTAANADIRSNGALQMGASKLGGNLALTAGGAITQSGALTVAGNLALTTTHNAGDVALDNSGAATTKLGNSSVGGNYSVTATGRNVAQNAGTAINVAGDFTVTASGVSTHPADNLVGGTDNTVGSGTFIKQVGVVTLNDINTAGDLTVLSLATGQVFAGPAVHGTAVTLSNAGNNIGGTVTVNTSGPAVVSSGAPVATGIQQAAGTSVQVGGASNFAASKGDVNLGNAGNSFGGAVSASGNNITLRGNGAIQLGAVNAAGALRVTAASGITQTSAGITAAGLSSLEGNGGAIILNTAGNDFTGAVTLSNTSGAISLTDTNTLALGTVNAAGALTIAAGGATTLNGDVTSTGVAFTGGGAGAVTLAGDVTISGRMGTVAMGAMTGGTRNLTVTGGDVALNGNWSGTGAYLLQPFADATTVGLAGGAGSFALSSAELANIAAGGASQVTIGRATGTGAVTVNAMTFDDKFKLQGGAVTFAAGSQNFGNGLEVASNGRVQLNGATVTATGGNITIAGTGAGAVQGFSMLGGAALRTASGTGNISISAANASGTAFSMGSGTNTIQADGAGNIDIQASAGGATGFGMSVGSGGTNTIRTVNGAMNVKAQSAGSDTSLSLGSGTNLFEATGTGNITVTSSATGGGVGVTFATSGANGMRTNSGNLSVTGSATGAGNGINMGSGAHTLASTSGNVLVDGTSNGSGNGVSFGTGANTIEAGGNGNVTINARSLGATGFGLSIGTSGTGNVRVANGALAINASSAGDDTAFSMGSGTNAVRATGSGSIAIVATASGTANGMSVGAGGANSIATTSGALTLNATGAGDGTGLALTSGTNGITSTGGNITIDARATGDGDGFAMSSGTNLVAAGGTGNLTLNTSAVTGNAASLGTASKTAGSNTLRVADGALTLNATSAGATSAFSMGVSSGAAGPATNTLEATLGGSVTVHAANTGSSNAVSMGGNSNNTIRTASGAIAVTGTSAQAAGISMASGNNTIVSGAGGVTLTGTSQGDGNGMTMGTGTNLVAATGNGNVTVNAVSQGTTDGFGLSMGTSGNNTLRVADGTLTVHATSTGADSALSMGSGTNTAEATGSGRVDLAGNATGSGNGVSMGTGGTNLVRTVSGRLDVSGTGDGDGEGISMGSGVNTIQSGSGAINLTGRALATGNGFYITSTGRDSVLTNTGDITITGISAGGDAIAIRPTADQATIEAAGAGNISFRADNYDASPSGAGSVRIAGNGGVLSIAQTTPGTSIGIGDGAAGTLNWSGAEIAQVSGFSLVRIGNSESGALDLRPPWFPFPMQLPPLTLTQDQRKLGMVKATVESLLSNLMSIGERPSTLAVTPRFSLLLQGFDDAKKP